MKRQYWGPSTEAVRRKKNKNEVEKKREVYRLEKDCDAWNIDGSSSDLPPQCSSWIASWESKTGLKRGICSYSDCNKPAAVGGHIWLKRRGPHIAPICSGCNHVENVERFQADDGKHSSFRQGTALVRVKLTEDMKKADRRIATYQLDSEYEEESSSESEREESSSESESEEDSSSDDSECQYMGSFQGHSVQGHSGSFSHYGAAASLRIRACQGCNKDISERPMYHTKCLECFRGSRLPESEEGDTSHESECEEDLHDESEREEDSSDDSESEEDSIGESEDFDY